MATPMVRYEGWGWTRRQVLQVGALGWFGLKLPHLLAADAERGKARLNALADACILVFLDGGPSHLDMWDMKPAAPPEIRGAFRPIATSLPGVQLCEHLPRLARLLHHCTLVRAAHHAVNNAHCMAVYTALTGHDRGDSLVAVGASPSDYPAIGAVTALMRPPQKRVVPFVSMPYKTTEDPGGPPQPGFFGGFLGRAHDPLFVLRDTNAPDFGVPELDLPEAGRQRLQERQQLLRALDRRLEAVRGDRNIQGLDGFRQQAFSLLRSPATQEAFQLDREPSRIRDSYGRNIYGQSLLLARRLVEAGTRVVTISWAPDNTQTWDTHSNNFGKLKETLLPQLDAGLSSLLTDLVARGMLQKTLVVVMGEFGRSPKINKNTGRDHWNFCYSLLLAGGGTKAGFVYGSSDKIGASPRANPVGAADIVATIYHCLGIPKTLELRDQFGRPFQLVPWGDPVEALLV